MPSSFSYDPPERGRGGRSSHASSETFHQQVKPNLQERESEVYAVILQHPEGITPKEVAIQMKRDLHTVSGRFKALREGYGLIRQTGERRDNSAVYVAVVVDEAGQTSLFQGAA